MSLDGTGDWEDSLPGAPLLGDLWGAAPHRAHREGVRFTFKALTQCGGQWLGKVVGEPCWPWKGKDLGIETPNNLNEGETPRSCLAVTYHDVWEYGPWKAGIIVVGTFSSRPAFTMGNAGTLSVLGVVDSLDTAWTVPFGVVPLRTGLEVRLRGTEDVSLDLFLPNSVSCCRFFQVLGTDFTMPRQHYFQPRMFRHFHQLDTPSQPAGKGDRKSTTGDVREEISDAILPHVINQIKLLDSLIFISTRFRVHTIALQSPTPQTPRRLYYPSNTPGGPTGRPVLGSIEGANPS
ncbi:hypothetical protein QBC43DRAFT_368492 [Cladorrhinum sp. PSN259]|nr:hypothetical protein QBC43DRAFT_368492 [Cladorrhinum sp. PSN259]